MKYNTDKHCKKYLTDPFFKIFKCKCISKNNIQNYTINNI